MTELTKGNIMIRGRFLTIVGALFAMLFMTHCGIVGALEPYVSTKTMKHHYQHHYSGYVSKANRLLKRSDLKNISAIEIIIETADNENYAEIFKNALDKKELKILEGLLEKVLKEV